MKQFEPAPVVPAIEKTMQSELQALLKQGELDNPVFDRHSHVQSYGDEDVDVIDDFHKTVTEVETTDDEWWKIASESILRGITIKLDESQDAAVINLATQQMGCLIGAAGTGKTTVTRFLLNALLNGISTHGIPPLRFRSINMDEYHKAEAKRKAKAAGAEIEDDDSPDERRNVIPAIGLCAFTGQAVQMLKKNMPPEWRSNCMTVHSMLGYMPVGYTRGDGSEGMRFEPTYTKTNKMPWKVIVIDESSMLNVQLWHELRDAMTDDCRVYFIGDLNQLTPPIGAGILGFALAKLPVSELTTVHRQKDDAANRIVDTAWRILQGKEPQFDDPTKDPRWRVIGFEIDGNASRAHEQICGLMKNLSKQRVSEKSDPNMPFIYDPWRDRVMTAMNGFNDNDEACMIGQFPINDTLSKIFGNHEPRIIINAKRSEKRFCVGYRVMATKNESPSVVDRVTNGLTGRIIAIEENPKWTGDRKLVGLETEVNSHKSDVFSGKVELDSGHEISFAEMNFDDIDVDLTAPTEAEEKQGGPASHIVTVAFDNGATREYNLNAQIDQLFIAYASTVHKAQGAEMPTAVIVCHNLQSRMLSREWLYTAVTRASQRVIILYTKNGLRRALFTQKISGRNLQEKVQQYLKLLGEDENGNGFKIMNVRLQPED